MLLCSFRTAYEDHDLVAVDKPWDAQLQHDATGPRWAGEQDLKHYLSERHPETLTPDASMRLCHQLDFATSGVIVAAKSHEAAAAVGRCFRERDARKLYAALVFGHPSFETTRWDDRIVTSKRRFRQKVGDGKGSKACTTDVTVGARGMLQLPGEHEGRPAALLWLEPRTGRRHRTAAPMHRV